LKLNQAAALVDDDKDVDDVNTASADELAS
jgi:hypothetical protein